MYQDINGKTALTNLIGASGKTYNHVKHLNTDERAAMLADGISEYIAPAKPAPTPEQLERKRKRGIRAATLERLKYSVLGDLEDGDERVASTLLDLLFVTVTLSQDLVNKGLISGSEYSPSVLALRQHANLMRSAKQGAREAITNGDSLELLEAALDLILTPPPEELL